MWKNRRKQTIVDRRFQWRMVRRLLLHWTSFIFASLTVLVGWHLIVGTALGFRGSHSVVRDTLLRYAPVIFVLWVMLPVLIWDVLKLSHSIVGPILRLRTTIQALNRGEEVEPVKLRRGDYCLELAADLNELIAQRNQLRERSRQIDQLLMSLPGEVTAVSSADEHTAEPGSLATADPTRAGRS